MKNILITGKNSYIGTSVKNWLSKEPSKYKINLISLKDNSWRNNDFSEYDIVLHVAGIAHVSSDTKNEDLYYKVNRDLTIEIAKKAKADGVKQFIFMSSIIVYGNSTSNTRVINELTIPRPSDFYGNSKLQAEEGIKPLESDEFKIVVVRPPMIYGKGSKGNYPKLAKLAKKTHIFPDIDNKRSMLHIDNLCEFLKIMIDYEEAGLFFPQNAEYVKTSEMVRLIAEMHGNKIWMTNFFNPIIKRISKNNLINKIFGNLVYSKTMSKYAKKNYQIRNIRESIEMTEFGK